MKTYKNHLTAALIFITVIAFIWPFTIETGLTKTGGISLYFSDFILLGVCCFNLLTYYKNREKYSKKIVIIITEWAFLAILLIYCIATIFRMVKGYYVYQSFEICFRTLAPLSLAIFIFKDKLTYKLWLRWVNYAITFVNVYSIVLHLFVYKYLRSDFLVNVNMVAFLCIVGVFVNALSFHYEAKNVIHIGIFGVNFCYYICVFCVVGSRAAAFMGALAIGSSIVCFINKENIRYYLGAGICGIVVVATLWSVNFGFCRSLMMRGFNFTTISESVSGIFGANNEDYSANLDSDTSTNIEDSKLTGEEKDNDVLPSSKTENKDLENEKDLSAEQIISESLLENDTTRFLFWKAAIDEIKKSPVLGTGKVGIADSEYGTQSAHNFVLEYCLVYGGLGFVAWLVFVMVYLANVIRKIKRISIKRFIFGLFGLLCTTLGFSFFEVTLITTFGSLVVWIAVFLFTASIFDDEEQM